METDERILGFSVRQNFLTAASSISIGQKSRQGLYTMQSDFSGQRINAARTITLGKAVIVGLLAAEVWCFGLITLTPLIVYAVKGGHEIASLIVLAISTAIVLAYGYACDYHSSIMRIIRSARYDLFFAFVIGIAVSLSFDGIGSNWYAAGIALLSVSQLSVLAATPLLIGLLLVVRSIQATCTEPKEESQSFFLSDIEKHDKNDDLLGYADDAERFAERVFNGGSSDSIVFGIDAPWGIGKSTFVNFCQEYWESKHKDHIIIYKFNPLRYEDDTKLLERFVDGLVRSIQKNAFLPEIRPLFSKYSHLITSKRSLAIPGLDLEIMLGAYTVDDAFEDLEIALGDLQKKVIIVVDDLDRLSFSAIKNVLFIIKKSFSLPNISYVLCYDTENITALEKEITEPDKISEFLEKFVNVKESLYIDSETLALYVSGNLAKALVGNSQADPVLVSKAVGGLIDIFKSPEYHSYLPFIGDIRKIKRLLNTLMFLEVEQTDFENSDFDKKDIINLLLIYINYPNIFRKIYNTETGGKRGFFSLVRQRDLNTGYGEERNYENSSLYAEYKLSLDKNQSFLLDQIFDATVRLEDLEGGSITEELKNTYACFNGNGSSGHNLERYLKLIVKLSKPQKREQYRFYSNAMKQIRQGTMIEDVLAGDEFAVTKSENSYRELWRVIVNSCHEYTPKVGAHLIDYLVKNAARHSLFTNRAIGVGLRDELEYFLVKLLDTVGWEDESGNHRNNTSENVLGIAARIFGDGDRGERGILETLARPEHSVLGLFDLLSFRLSCSADRGGDIFNLTRALAIHGDPNAPTEGKVSLIAIAGMREISQTVFRIFKEQYITPRTNVFTEIDELTLSDICGDWAGFVENQVAEGVITRDETDTVLATMKSRFKSFINYQLGNSVISSGVGCGYYDEAGAEDNNGIATAMNDYLFDICFDPAEQTNYGCFLDYLLLNLTSDFGSGDGRFYVPNIDEITKVLDRTRLADYWRSNAEAIRSWPPTLLDKGVVTASYNATYAEDLEGIFSTLDRLVEEMDAPDTNTETKPETPETPED